MISFCGVFEGTIEMRRGESTAIALARAERMLFNATDRIPSLKLNIGIDHDEAHVVEASIPTGEETP
jgi:hypothetical protein